MKGGIAQMEITFTNKNGMCPFFIHNDIKYYIQDTRDNHEDGYKYCLMKKKLDKETFGIKKIEDLQIFLDKEKTKHVYSNFNGSTKLYGNKNHYFKVDYGLLFHRVTKFHREEFLLGSYDSYLTCLNDSKEYIERIIKLSEPEQISLF